MWEVGKINHYTLQNEMYLTEFKTEQTASRIFLAGILVYRMGQTVPSTVVGETGEIPSDRDRLEYKSHV